MRKLVVFSMLLGASACGSTSTDNSGTPTPTPGGAAFCSQFTAGTGLICDTATNPPTLKVNVGTGAGTVAAGDDPRIGGSGGHKYLGEFTPSATQGNPVTMASPGGQMSGAAAAAANAGGVGQIIYNAASGRVGVRAANEICAAITDWSGKTAAVPSAHACSMEELVSNVNAGNIPSGSVGMAYSTTPYVVYAGDGVSDTSNNSWKSDCGGWTYNSADLYKGTMFSVGPQTARNNLVDGTKTTGIKFTSGIACSTAAPVACCE